MSVNFNKNATINTTGISETLINPFDTEFYYEPDNTAWVRLVHHNDPSTNRFVNTDTFASSVYKSANLWFNVALCNLVNKYEFMVKQALTAGGTEEKYRWIQTKNPLEAVYEDVTIDKITRVTTSGYINPGNNYAGIYKHNSNTYIVCANGTKGNWFCALGNWTLYQGGMPVYNGKVSTTGYLDLYIRVDNLDNPTKASIYNDSLLANNILEV